MEREPSKKLRALQKVFGKPWHEVALQWAAEPLSQREIAERWTQIVGAMVPGMVFRQQEVARIIRRATERAASPAEVAA